jgi:aminoglycoside phosphotransferase (APT) family kinase protein
MVNQLIRLDEGALQRDLAGMLGEVFGRPVAVASMTREPSPFATVFPAEILRVELVGGDTMALFLKHVGTEQWDHPEKQRRDREIKVYARLLHDRELPVPGCLGARWNEATQRHQLFLEYVEGWSLKYHHMDHWFAAARELARLHRHFARNVATVQEADFLLSFDADYYRAWAHRARDVVRECYPALLPPLADIIESYGRAVDILTAQPPTLVHNDLSPKNVLIDLSGSMPRICFVDWEMSGVGCGLLDLVHLKYGLQGEDERGMLEAYRAALAGTGILPEVSGAWEQLLAACELHKAFHRLWRSRVWQTPADVVEQWIGEAREFWTRI